MGSILAVLSSPAPLLDSVAQLRQLDPGMVATVETRCAVTAADRGGGRWCWSATSGLADDGVMVVNTTGHAGPGRFVRDTEAWGVGFGILGDVGEIDVRWAGAVGDGVTDDTAAIQAAINVAGSLGVAIGIYFPQGKWKITSPLRLPSGTRKFTMRGPGGVALKPDYIPPENRGAVIYCKGVTGTVLDLWTASDLGTVTNLRSFGVCGLTFDASNGGGAAAGSTTCTGFVPMSPADTPPTGTNRMSVRITDCSFSNILTDAAVGMDLSRYFWCQIENTYIGHIPNGIGIKIAGSSYASTTVTIRKAFFQECFECTMLGANTMDVTFDGCVFESSRFALVAIATHVRMRDCWMENMGLVPGTRQVSITKKGGATGDNIDSIMFVRGATLDCTGTTFAYSTEGTSLAGWMEGSGASVGSGTTEGHASFGDCVTTSRDIPFFTPATAPENRNGFVIEVDDPCYTFAAGDPNGVACVYADARCVTRGHTRVIFGEDDARPVSIRNGRFEYGQYPDTAYSGGLTDAPDGGVNLAGDRVIIAAPAAGAYSAYQCTTSGTVESPVGTWKGVGLIES